jgi:hypothetical protein
MENEYVYSQIKTYQGSRLFEKLAENLGLSNDLVSSMSHTEDNINNVLYVYTYKIMINFTEVQGSVFWITIV